MNLYGKRYTILYRFILFYMFKWREHSDKLENFINHVTKKCNACNTGILNNKQCLECEDMSHAECLGLYQEKDCNKKSLVNRPNCSQIQCAVSSTARICCLDTELATCSCRSMPYPNGPIASCRCI